MKTLIIIPSRLSATRLPGKPLLKINGKSIISHVVKKAEEANKAAAAIDDQKHILKSIDHNNLWLPKITKELENIGFHTIPSSCNFVLFEVSEKLSFDANLDRCGESVKS